MKKALIVSAALMVPMLLVGCVPKRTASVSAPAETAARTPEQDLALADTGNLFAGAETPYAAMLDSVGQKCIEGRRDLADLTAKVVEVTGKEGVRTNNLDVLTEASKAVAEYKQRQNCQEIYTSIALVMIGNKNK